MVTVTFSKPLLTNETVANSVFHLANGGGNVANPVNGDKMAPEHLTDIDVTGLGTAANGLGIKVAVKHGLKGDGLATVGYINASGNLGAVAIQGDLGRIDAQTTTAAKTALNSLTVQTMGRYGTLTGAPNVVSEISGKVGLFTVKGDMSGEISATAIGSVTIGGSLVGIGASTGVIFANGTVTSIKIAGDIQGGTGAGSGQVTVGTLGSITVGGSLIGGTASGAGEIAATAIGSVKIGHDIVAGTVAFSGIIDTNETIGSVTLGGSLIGTAAQAAVISAQGKFSPATQAASVAIATITIAGRVEHGQILAGYDYSTLSATNGDASIGTVTVKGDWIASDLVAGINHGNDGRFGQKAAGDLTVDDGVIASGLGTAAIRSDIGAVSIGGVILGTSSSTDSHAFAAEDIGPFKVGGVKLNIPSLVFAFAPFTNFDVVYETFVI